MDIAVVTGAGRGLGRLVCRRLAARGLVVLATDIDADAAADTAKALGGDAFSMQQDVRDPEGHRRVAAAAAERGRVAVWVNNAGVLRTGAAWEASDEDDRLQVEVNVLGVIWGSKAAVGVMREGGGHIVNVGSISSIVPAPGLGVYGATKHAVLGFSLSLQGDLQRAGLDIQVSTICPDAIETDMVRGVEGEEGSTLLFSANRLLAPDDVADRLVALLDRPRLVQVHPARRGLLAHVLRPFPGVGLRALDFYWKRGDRNRRRRAQPDD